MPMGKAQKHFAANFGPSRATPVSGTRRKLFRPARPNDGPRPKALAGEGALGRSEPSPAGAPPPFGAWRVYVGPITTRRRSAWLPRWPGAKPEVVGMSSLLCRRPLGPNLLGLRRRICARTHPPRFRARFHTSDPGAPRINAVASSSASCAGNRQTPCLEWIFLYEQAISGKASDANRCNPHCSTRRI